MVMDYRKNKKAIARFKGVLTNRYRSLSGFNCQVIFYI